MVWSCGNELRICLSSQVLYAFTITRLICYNTRQLMLTASGPHPPPFNVSEHWIHSARLHNSQWTQTSPPCSLIAKTQWLVEEGAPPLHDLFVSTWVDVLPKGGVGRGVRVAYLNPQP